MFTLAISVFDHFQLTLIHGPNISGSYAIFFFTALDFTFTSRPIHNWVSSLLWLSLFIPSGALSLLLLQQHTGHLLAWQGVYLSASYIFAFSYSSWGSQGRNGEWFAITFSTTLEVVQAQLMIRLRIQGSLWLKKGRRHKRWGVVCLAPSNLFHLQLVENPIQTGIGKEYRNFCYQKVKR